MISLLWPLLHLLTGPALGQEATGFLELRAQAYAGVDGVPIALVERFRPELSASLRERVSLTTVAEVGFAQGWDSSEALEALARDAGLGATFEAAGLFPEEEANALLGVSEVGDYLSVERLYLDWYLPSADFRFGRQAVNWGSAIVVNPTDPFPEVLLTEPWRPRSGVNAARATVPFGELNEAQVVIGADDAFQYLRAAGRVRINVLGADVAMLGAWRQQTEDGLVGLDIKGTLGVGFWAEGAWHLSDDPYEELAVGVDYSFNVLESLLVAAQYYRNGAGAAYDPSTGVLPGADDEDRFASAFGGTDYGMLTASLGLTRMLSASGLMIQNLGDGSGLIVPTLMVLPTERLDVSLAAQIPVSTWGEGGELRPADEDLVINLPDPDGAPQALDLGRIVPDAVVILWTRYNF